MNVMHHVSGLFVSIYYIMSMISKKYAAQLIEASEKSKTNPLSKPHWTLLVIGR